MLDTSLARDNNLQVNFAGSAEEFIDRCDALQRADKTAEERRHALFYTSIGLFAVAFISFAAQAELITWISAIAALIALGAAWWSGTHDLEDRKIEIPKSIVMLLGGQLRRARQLAVDIDFRGYWRFSADESWLSLKLPLANGAAVSITIETKCRRKSKPKGKYTKLKDRLVERLSIRIFAPRGVALAPTPAPLSDALKVGPLLLSGAQITEKHATFSFTTAPFIRLYDRSGWHEEAYQAALPDGRDVVRAIVASYGLLGQLGRVAAANHAQAQA